MVRVFNLLRRQINANSSCFFTRLVRVQHRQTEKVIVGLITILLVCGACRKKSVMTTSAIGTGSPTNVTGAGSLNIALAVIDDVKAALINAGMKQSEAQVIATGALQGLNNVSLAQGFSLTNDPFSPELAIPRIIAGAIKALSDERAGQTEAKGKLQYLGTITEGVVESLGTGAAAGLSDELKKSLPAGIAKTAVASIKTSGLSDADVSSGIGKVMEGAVAKLKGVGFAANDLKAVVSDMTKETIAGIKEIQLSKTLIGPSLKSLVKSTVGALDDAGVGATEVGEFVGPIMTEAVGGISDLGLSSLGQMQSVVGDLVASTVTAFKDAGLSKVEDVALALEDCMQGTMVGLRQEANTKDKITVFVDDMMKGAVSNLTEIGFAAAKDIETLSSSVTSDTISYLDDIGITDADAVKAASGAIAAGTMLALGDLKKSNQLTVPDLDLATASKLICANATDAIYDLGFTDSIATVASGFTTGMVSGLAEAGLSNQDITNLSDEIADGFSEALSNEAGIDPSALSNYTAAINTSTSSAISQMQIDCENANGTWFVDEGYCEYPITSQEGNSIVPSEEEDACYDKGGIILILPNNTWQCDLSEAEGDINTQAGCIDSNANYKWARGPDGEYCETYEAPSSCWYSLEASSCAQQASCSWLVDYGYCESSEMISCSYFTSATSCTAIAGCAWDTTLNSCLVQINGDGTENSNTDNTTTAPTNTPPDPGHSGHITALSVLDTSLILNWNKAIDDSTGQSELTYRAYYSTSTLGTSVTSVEQGTAIGGLQQDIDIQQVSGLTDNTLYYFNTVVTDHSGNKSIYTEVEVTTLDSLKPNPGNHGMLTISKKAASSLHLNWTKGIDIVTPASSLTYIIAYHTSSMGSTPSAIISSGASVLPPSVDIDTIKISGLNHATTYFFNIIITDLDGYQAAYMETSVTTDLPWELEVTTTSANENMTIEFDSPLDIKVDWGDGSADVVNINSKTHTYTSPGTYTMTIEGEASRISFFTLDAETRLTEILSPVRGIGGITSFKETFCGLTELRGSIPAGMFDKTPNVTSFEATFKNADNLTGPIPENLFANNPNVTSFESTFKAAASLSGPIPDNLFANNPSVTSFGSTFEATAGLTGPIPDNLFANNPSVTSFEATFRGALSLTGSIPSDLFSYNKDVTTFAATFEGAVNLTGSIPAGLFDNNEEVTIFRNTFYGTTGLTGPIPAGLFDYNPKVSSFESTFKYASNLTAIPSGLFDNNPQVNTFSYTFYSASGLTGSIPPGLFNNNNIASDFTGTFSGANGITGEVPELWTIFSSLENTNNCFEGLTSTSNYGAIPTEWK